ncbi:MAG: metallophosphoesterase [Pseudomonadota bacterium]
MSSIFYVGDIHGQVDALGDVVQKAEALDDSSTPATAIVQVGDFGWGFSDKRLERWLEKRARQRKWSVPIYTCLGNHDNWYRLEELRSAAGSPSVFELAPGSGCFYVARGACIELGGINHLFLGGAESTDKHGRTEGVDWWRTEQPSAMEFDHFFYALASEEPEVVVTHEAPLRVRLERSGRETSMTPKMLEQAMLLSDHRPARWYFGHHHVRQCWQMGETDFYGCGLHGEYWRWPLETVTD